MNRREGRRDQGGRPVGHTAEAEGGEVPHPAPPPGPSRGQPPLRKSLVCGSGEAGPRCPPEPPCPPPLLILAGSRLTPCLPPFPPGPPLPWASIITSRGGSCSPKYRHLTLDSEQSVGLLGLGCSSSLRRLLPTVGFSIGRVTGWGEDGDGQEGAEGSVVLRPTAVLQFPPGAPGSVSQSFLCELRQTGSALGQDTRRRGCQLRGLLQPSEMRP